MPTGNAISALRVSFSGWNVLFLFDYVFVIRLMNKCEIFHPFRWTTGTSNGGVNNIDIGVWLESRFLSYTYKKNEENKLKLVIIWFTNVNVWVLPKDGGVDALNRFHIVQRTTLMCVNESFSSEFRLLSKKEREKNHQQQTFNYRPFRAIWILLY